MPEFRESLHPNCFYHIYNDANGIEKLFERELDYFHFKFRLKKYIHPIADILSYCLQQDRFHIVIQIKSELKIIEFLKRNLTEEQFLEQCDRECFIEKKLSRICSNFFNSYAKKFNLTHGRSGNLFKRAFRRESITDMDDLRTLINEIHHIPVYSGIVNIPESWKYSSFSSLISDKISLLKPKKVWRVFGGKSNFIDLHQKNLDLILSGNKSLKFYDK